MMTVPEERMSPPADALVLPPQPSRWRRRGIVFGVVTAVACATFGVLWWRSGDQSAEARAIVDRLIKEAEIRPAARPVLRGEAVPGNAWDDYALALDESEKLKQHRDVISGFATGAPHADRAAVEALLAQSSKAVEHLRRGVRRAEARYPHPWAGVWSKPMTSGLTMQTLGQLCVSRSKLLREQGEAVAAAELMMDVAQFGRDLRHNGVLLREMLGIAISGIAFEELRDMLVASELSKESCAQMARELGVLEGAMPRAGVSMHNECAGLGALLLQVGDAGAGDPGFDWRKTWRYGFSSRRMGADAIVRYESIARRASAQADVPWRDAEQALLELHHEALGSGNSFLQTTMALPFPVMRAERERVAHLRLLRVAAHWKATGEVLALDDPFGGKILHVGTRFWSVGPNGVDDGGTGHWKGQSDKDMVLEARP